MQLQAKSKSIQRLRNIGRSRTARKRVQCEPFQPSKVIKQVSRAYIGIDSTCTPIPACSKPPPKRAKRSASGDSLPRARNLSRTSPPSRASRSDRRAVRQACAIGVQEDWRESLRGSSSRTGSPIKVASYATAPSRSPTVAATTSPSDTNGCCGLGLAGCRGSVEQRLVG